MTGLAGASRPKAGRETQAYRENEKPGVL